MEADKDVATEPLVDDVSATIDALLQAQPSNGPQPASSPPKPKLYTASIYPGTGPGARIDTELAEAVLALEGVMKTPVLVVIQDRVDEEDPFTMLAEEVGAGFYEEAKSLERDRPVSLLIHSNGGLAKPAYQIARFLNAHCGHFDAIVPDFAKSAATLLALGARRVIMGEHAELGPLDAQVFDADREEFSSALNEVQSLERLQAFSLSALDAAVLFTSQRTHKRIGSLLPICLQHVAELTRPLFEKIDTVHYTSSSRLLKIGEEYAIRLLAPQYGEDLAKNIARALVHNYPDHGFMIDSVEAGRLGLRTFRPTPEQSVAMEALKPHLNMCTVIGRVVEVTV